METPYDFLREQYIYVHGARGILLDYCKKITPEHFLFENPSFGNGGSMRNLLVHTANSYQAWIGGRVLGKSIQKLNFSDYRHVNDIAILYAAIDELMAAFFESAISLTKEITFEKGGYQQSASPLKIFTHVITHEFHHKGQLLSMSRYLGYTPTDTDIQE